MSLRGTNHKPYAKRTTTPAMLDSARKRPPRKKRPVEAHPAIAVYQLEKARAQSRLAAKDAAIKASLNAVLEREREARESRGQGGRPKRTMPDKDFTRDPANALVGALGPWSGE